MPFYQDIKKAKETNAQLLAILSDKQRSRLKAELITGNPVTAVTVSEVNRPESITYFVEATGTDTVSINGGQDITIIHDAVTVNEDVGYSGLDMVFGAVLTVGQTAEIRVTGDYMFPEIGVTMATKSQNTGSVLGPIDRSIDNLERLEQIHGWYNLDRDSADKVLAGREVTKPTTTQVYYVKSSDTWELIERRFGVSYKEIVKINKITPSDLAPGLRLLIPIEENGGRIRGLKVLGPHTGRLAWGRDINKSFDIIGGDLKLNNNTETLLQTICTIVEHAAWKEISEAFPADSHLEMAAENLKSAIAADKRVKAVKIVEVRRENTGMYIKLGINPVNGQPYNIMFYEAGNRNIIECECNGEVIPLTGVDVDGGGGGGPVLADYPNLVLYAKFNADGGASYLDDTGNFTLTDNNTTYSSGIGLNGSYSFTAGLPSYVTIPHDTLLNIVPGNDMTIEFRIRCDNIADFLAISKNQNLGHWAIGLDADSGIYLRLVTTGVVNTVSKIIPYSYTLGTFITISMVVDRADSELRTYVDGSLIDTITSFNNVNEYGSTGTVGVGYYVTFPSKARVYGSGYIDDFRVWSEARTPTQIANFAGSELFA